MEIQGNMNNLNWIAGGWSLGGSIAFAIGGQLSDYFGRKGVVLAGQVLLLVGHLLGATAQTFNQLIAAMVILGAGAGLVFVIYPGISEMLPNKWRAFGLAITEIFISGIGTFGALIGRRLTADATWRWIFILGDIAGIIALVGTILAYHPPRRVFSDRTKREILSELDYVGLFMYVAGMTFLLLGLGWPGSGVPWRSAKVIITIIVGGVVLILTAVWDFSGIPRRPLFAPRLFRNFRGYASLLIINCSSGLAHIALTSLVPQQIQLVFTSDPTTAGWYNVPSGVGSSIGGIVIGGLVARMGHVPIQLAVANIIQAVCCGLLSIVTPQRVAEALVLHAFANLPFLWTLIVCYATAGVHVPHRDIGLAYGLLGATRYLGGAVGSTVLNTILRTEAAFKVPERVIEAVRPFGIPASKVNDLIAVINQAPPDNVTDFPLNVQDAAITAIRWGYSDAFKYVWYTSVPFFVVACIVSPFVQDPSPYFTNHTAVTMGKPQAQQAREQIAKHEKAGIAHTSQP
ncbi:hypothetical protein K4F52_010193 [Lecanicillium sp. MT-2017a]|nr:hypothetical protein K4F52_010193 [Lecanicillium sp. MT-2017a]